MTADFYMGMMLGVILGLLFDAMLTELLYVKVKKKRRMVEAVCPVCHLTWNLFTGRHTHEQRKYGRVVRIVTMRSQMCPSCQKKVDESKIRLIEGERGVI